MFGKQLPLGIQCFFFFFFLKKEKMRADYCMLINLYLYRFKLVLTVLSVLKILKQQNQILEYII